MKYSIHGEEVSSLELMRFDKWVDNSNLRAACTFRTEQERRKYFIPLWRKSDAYKKLKK